MTSSRFDIRVLPDSFAQSGVSGNVTGRISVCLDEASFPDEQWHDFVVIILGWWIDEIIRLYRGTKERAELLFMDGPYTIRISRSEGEQWRLECVHRHVHHTEIESQAVIQPDEVLTACAAAARFTIAACIEQGWAQTDDLLRLQARIEELHQLFVEVKDHQ